MRTLDSNEFIAMRCLAIVSLLILGLHAHTFYSKEPPYEKLSSLSFPKEQHEETYQLVRLLAIENSTPKVMRFFLNGKILNVDGKNIHLGENIARAEPFSYQQTLVLVNDTLFIQKCEKRIWLANSVKLFAFDHILRHLYILYDDDTIWVRNNPYCLVEKFLETRRDIRDIEASCGKLISFNANYSISIDGNVITTANHYAKIPFLYYDIYGIQAQYVPLITLILFILLMCVVVRWSLNSNTRLRLLLLVRQVFCQLIKRV